MNKKKQNRFMNKYETNNSKSRKKNYKYMQIEYFTTGFI